MTDQTKNDMGDELVKKGQEAASELTEEQKKAYAEEAVAFEQELKKKLRENGKTLGIEFGPNTSIASMRDQLMAAKELILNSPSEEQGADEPESEFAARRKLKLENTKLVRIQIACVNPNKADLPGEIFSVHNDFVGTVKKFVPYNEAGDAYHVPMMLLKFLKRKKFLQIVLPPKGSHAPPTTKMVPEFAITILDPLTKQELAELARAQGAAEASDSN